MNYGCYHSVIFLLYGQYKFHVTTDSESAQVTGQSRAKIESEIIPCQSRLLLRGQMIRTGNYPLCYPTELDGLDARGESVSQVFVDAQLGQSVIGHTRSDIHSTATLPLVATNDKQTINMKATLPETVPSAATNLLVLSSMT